jgi:hypothetical protein
MPANREQVEQIVAAAPNFRNRWEGFLKNWEQEEMSHRDFGAAPFRQWLGPRSLVVWDEVEANRQRVAVWTAQNKPRWWQFWRRRSVFNAEQALEQVESAELKKIIEANYRKMR